MNTFFKILGTLMLIIIGWLVTKYTARMLWWANGDGMSFTGIVLSCLAIAILVFTWGSIHFCYKRVWKREMFTKNTTLHLTAQTVLIFLFVLYTYVVGEFQSLRMYLDSNTEIKLGLMIFFILGLLGFTFVPKFLDPAPKPADTPA